MKKFKKEFLQKYPVGPTLKGGKYPGCGYRCLNCGAEFDQGGVYPNEVEEVEWCGYCPTEEGDTE